jgi:hypothetical protein
MYRLIKAVCLEYGLGRLEYVVEGVKVIEVLHVGTLTFTSPKHGWRV